ncbi:MAG: GNAT family N-acetyltransferase [Acidimicrobiales bacterium]
MDVRFAKSGDREAIESVVASAFGGSHGRDVVEMVRGLDRSGVTRASLVAAEGEVVGHVQLSRGWIDTREELVEIVVLSPLSVAPSQQRQGIGTQLVNAALTEAALLGFPAVFLEGNWNYYGSRGFTNASERGFIRPSVRIPLRAFQVALLPGYENWMVGQLVYPEAFWVADAVGVRDPRLRAVEERSGDSRSRSS